MKTILGKPQMFYKGFIISIVEAGTEIKDPDTQESAIVADDNAVVLHSTVYVTKPFFLELKAKIDEHKA